LSFLAANLGSLELMGWAASAYQYGILAVHWYWIGAIPAMLFLGVVMIPFYYISKTHSRARIPQIAFRRTGARSLRRFFRPDDGVHERHQHVLDGAGHEGGAGVGYSLSVSGSPPSPVMLYVGLGGLLSAIFNEVLQFVLIWLGAMLISIIGLIEGRRLGRHGGQDSRQLPARQLHPRVEQPWALSTIIRWASTGWASCSGWGW